MPAKQKPIPDGGNTARDDNAQWGPTKTVRPPIQKGSRDQKMKMILGPVDDLFPGDYEAQSCKGQSFGRILLCFVVCRRFCTRDAFVNHAIPRLS